jgi:hypothetical protein
MQKVFIMLLVFCTGTLFAQSKSITRFRSDFKENTNMFFYSSTLKMLNTDNNPELADILKGIEEIRVLNYNKASSQFTGNDVADLKNALKDEAYNAIMMINEKSNSINLYSREKHGRTVGFVAVVENHESLVLIDLIGTIDVKKFMELKQKLDNRTGSTS